MKTLYKFITIGSIIMILSAAALACKEKEENKTSPNSKTDASLKAAVNNSDTAVTGNYDCTLAIDGSDSYEISDTLYGLFFEDINFAADGGLYAEMIKNRSFEFSTMAVNRNFHGWRTVGEVTYEIIDGTADGSCLNENNTHYLKLTNRSGSDAGISNGGFLDGMSIKGNAVYRFSGYFRSPEGYQGSVKIVLRDNSGKVYGETKLSGIKNEWWKYEAEITASAAVSKNLRLAVLIGNGTVDMDMISLFPKDTYKGRENGLRKDLGEALEALSPKFLRFPGGCVVEGKSLSSAYSWKDSIGNGMAFTVNGKVTYGDIAARPLAKDIWGNFTAESSHPYYMTYGLGFYDYFLLCEDLNAQPVPILNAGMSCQFQGARVSGISAQSAEIGSVQFQQYVQDALDLVEFCRGGSDTKWGAIRIAMGHEKPFDLNYIGIGNEQWGDAYFSRYEAFKKAFAAAAEKNPELYGKIKLIVSNGPAAGDHYARDKIKIYGNDYADLADEHYYMVPQWFLTNTSRYDSYDRSSVPVFLGEYAAKSNNAEAALSEAAYMTGLERNGDIVKMACYAPLFGNSVSYQWTPDLIFFNGSKSWLTVNYLVQKIFSNNKSSKVLKSTLGGNTSIQKPLSGFVGAGTWMTAASFDDIKAISNDTGEVLYSADFNSGTLIDWTRIHGNWSTEQGKLVQTNTKTPVNTITGDVIYTGDKDWTDYTLTMKATKAKGKEGFIIPFAVKDENNFFHWNIGGWNNTVSCLEQTVSGYKSGQIPETVKKCSITSGKEYDIKIVVNGNTIQCYLDGSLMIDYVVPQPEALYQVTGIGEDGDLIIKLVNISDEQKNVLIQVQNLDIPEGPAKVYLLTAESLTDMNTSGNPDKVKITEDTINAGSDFIYSAPKYSVTVIRIPAAR